MSRKRRVSAAPTTRGRLENGSPCALLVTGDSGTERSLVRSLKKRCVAAELARSLLELEARVTRDDLAAPDVVFLDLELPDAAGEDWVRMVRRSFAGAALVAFGEDLNAGRAARLLGLGVPSLHKPVDPAAFARLALELCTAPARELQQGGVAPPPSAGAGRVGGLVLALESYASIRALSNQQRLILGFYLSGENDKQIAGTLLCSEATVYEHWRRMGKKAGGTAKSAVISDFHRFLVHN
jgi:DNA-binding NarL/FixJ family response regulator